MIDSLFGFGFACACKRGMNVWFAVFLFIFFCYSFWYLYVAVICHNLYMPLYRIYSTKSIERPLTEIRLFQNLTLTAYVCNSHWSIQSYN